MIGIIAALSPEGVIGIDGQIPWHYSADMKRFKRVTMGAAVIMGRLTWESMPRRPLKGRRNIVITSSSTSAAVADADTFTNIDSALSSCDGHVWFIGGRRIYEEAMLHADLMDLTFVPDRIESADTAKTVYFPSIDPERWQAGPLEVHPDDQRLRHRIYRRITM